TGGRAIQVFDARPLTPEIKAEREALGLLEFLYARPLRKADIIEHLKHSPTITPAARQRALALVESYREEADPERYSQASRALLPPAVPQPRPVSLGPPPGTDGVQAGS